MRCSSQLHGIGPWTADLYLLACLGHADAWPAGDLALQEAARLAFGLRQAARPRRRWDRSRTGWRPWRAVAARLLWSYYRVVKKREGVLTASLRQSLQRQSLQRRSEPRNGR